LISERKVVSYCIPFELFTCEKQFGLSPSPALTNFYLIAKRAKNNMTGKHHKCFITFSLKVGDTIVAVLKNRRRDRERERKIANNWHHLNKFLSLKSCTRAEKTRDE
jgi:hypothetical protein